MAGAAKRAINPEMGIPDRPVYIAGFGRGKPATGIHDDLYARAMVLSDASGVSVGLVVLDLIGLFHDEVLAIRDELKSRYPDVPADYLVVASTHTHASPDVIGLWTPIGGSVDAGYIARVRTAAVEAVAEAWRGRLPARLYVAQSAAADLASDSRLPEVIDDTVLVMGLRTLSGDEGIASLVNWNSHPSVIGSENTELSADFLGGTVALMEKEWGGTALYASGAVGGQIGSGRVKVRDPLTGEIPESRMRRAEILGERIGEIALEALQDAVAEGPASVPAIRFRSRTLHVPMENPDFALGLSIRLIHPRRLYLRDGSGPGLLPADLADPSGLRSGAYTLATEVGMVDLGAARWAMIPGELYPEIALGKPQEPPDPAADYPDAAPEPPLRPLSDVPVFLIGLANDELGYIIPKSQWDSRPPFAYGRDEPQYGERLSVGPETAPLLMEALRVLFSEEDEDGDLRSQAAGLSNQ